MTLTIAYFTRMLETTAEPTRSVVRALLADEVDHGRLGGGHAGARHTPAGR